uniref:Mitochondrial fission factor n=1 Tax=Panagrellus redivivus TaxID=6233 RepID=A0A7E4ZTM9_PANRE
MFVTAAGMEVPEHIYVNGGNSGGRHRAKHNSFSGSGINDGVAVREDMRVPDRIVLGGGDTHYASRQAPTEVMADQVSSLPKLNHGEVPAVITANDLYQHEATNTYRSNAAMSDTSIAIDENPLRELKLMRRQLGRLSTRVMQLEDENGRRNTRETSLWITLIGSIAVIVTLLTRKNFRF